MQFKRKILLILMVLLVAHSISGGSIYQEKQTTSLTVPSLPISNQTLSGQAVPLPHQATTDRLQTENSQLDESLPYNSKEDVALFLHTYGRLPVNYITKAQARALGWPGGDLRPYAPDNSIGGDRFGNYEGLLPIKKGRVYYECDIDTLGKSSRGKRRIVFSNDGLVYYTDDHYESFVLLYGGKEQ